MVRIACPDRKGLVHVITGALLAYKLNVVSNHEFVDRSSEHFFMRTEVEGPRLRARALKLRLERLLGKKASVEIIPPRLKRSVILVSREPHCLGELLIRHAYQQINTSIQAVIGNHPDLGALCRKFSVPFLFIPHGKLGREAHEARILKKLKAFNPEYLILAKYMRILSARFTEGFRNRIINIHHSFLPAFSGAKPYHQAYERGVKIIGATAHFVTSELDQGPIISQAVIPVNHTQGPSDMAQAGRDIEKIVLANALKLVFEDRLFVCSNKTVVFE